MSNNINTFFGKYKINTILIIIYLQARTFVRIMNYTAFVLETAYGKQAEN